MKQRRLGSNGPRISALGLGCMSFSPGTCGLPAMDLELSTAELTALDSVADAVTGPRYADMSWVNR